MPKNTTNTTEQVQRISLPADVVQATLDYLATRPFREVANLINSIQTQHEKLSTASN